MVQKPLSLRARHVLFTLLLPVVALPCAAAVELCVDPAQGSDRTGVGTAQAPLASVQAALRKARDLRRCDPAQVQGGVTITVSAGTHVLSETLVLGPADSGTAEAPLILRGKGPSATVLSGGIALSGWRKLEAGHARVSPAAQGQLWVAECRDAVGAPLPVRQLWVGETKAERARFPDAPEMARLAAWDPAAEEAGSALEGLPTPADLRGVEMFVLQQWETANLRLASLRRENGLVRLRFRQPESRIEFEHPWPQPIMPPEGAGAFLLVGAPEFISRPGEWAQEPDTGRILYWPRSGETPGDLRAVVPSLETLLRIEGTLDSPVSHVRLTDLGFAHAAWRRPSESGHVPLQAGMYLTDGYRIEPKGTPDSPTLDNQAWVGRPGAALLLSGVSDVVVERCRVAQTAMSGLDVARAAERVSVSRCVFEDIGGNALQAGSFQEGEGVETHLPYNPSDERVLVRSLTLADNRVRDAANEDWGCVGILAGYVRDTIIEYNEVSDVSYTAISLGWGWTRTVNCMRNNVVRGNLLHRYATRMCDTAGVYTLSAQPGTVVCENVVRDVRISPWVDRPDHWFYLYTDEGSAYLTVRDNWTEQPKFLQNANGPNNVWENNGPQVSPLVVARAGVRP